ncbi:MAG: trypsin-like peptidase domain-containing protein [Kofleriaceae bacterium]
MSILDELPYPFHKPMAQELLRVMLALYRSEREALFLVEQHGIDPADVTPNLTPRQLWHDLLQMGNARGVTADIVKAAREQNPKNPRADFLDSVLAGKTTPTSAEPTDNTGKPAPFITGDDKVTKPEALLFFDDLTIPTGGVPALIETLMHVVQRVPSVCLLRVKNPFGEFVGTGFRIGPELVLTNEHVLFPRRQVAVSVFADFDFDVDRDDKPLNVVSLPGDAASIAGNRDDDWAVVKVPGMAAAVPVIDLAAAPAPRVGDAAYILQHPAGRRKRLGYVRNTISDFDDRVVHYLTDTEPGSSGSPVFDTAGRCIALHHAGGEPQEVAGKPPVSKNEGILISRVLAGLKAKGLL